MAIATIPWFAWVLLFLFLMLVIPMVAFCVAQELKLARLMRHSRKRNSYR